MANRLPVDRTENMSLGDYFQIKLDTRDMLAEKLPEPFHGAGKKLCDAILHTETLEEKTGVIQTENLSELLSDRDALFELLAQKEFRRSEVRDIIDRMVLQQTVHQEAIRQEMESLRNELMQCKTIIEDLSRRPKLAEVDGPSLDTQLIRSKMYQFISNVDVTRRELSDNIMKLRAATVSNKPKDKEEIKDFSKIPLRVASGFFSRIKGIAESLKNKLYAAIDQKYSKAAHFVNDLLDSASDSLHAIGSKINGYDPKDWDNQMYLYDHVKKMVLAGSTEKKISKYIDSFCSDTGLDKTTFNNANKYLKELLQKQKYAPAAR